VLPSRCAPGLLLSTPGNDRWNVSHAIQSGASCAVGLLCSHTAADLIWHHLWHRVGWLGGGRLVLTAAERGGTCALTSEAGREAQAGGLKKESISPPGKKNDLRRGALTSSLSKELSKRMTPKKMLHGPEAFDDPREVRDRWRGACTALGLLCCAMILPRTIALLLLGEGANVSPSTAIASENQPLAGMTRRACNMDACESEAVSPNTLLTSENEERGGSIERVWRHRAIASRSWRAFFARTCRRKGGKVGSSPKRTADTVGEWRAAGEWRVQEEQHKRELMAMNAMVMRMSQPICFSGSGQAGSGGGDEDSALAVPDGWSGAFGKYLVHEPILGIGEYQVCVCVCVSTCVGVVCYMPFAPPTASRANASLRGERPRCE
jgi:hypothetical protein